MPLYTTAENPAQLGRAYERSAAIALMTDTADQGEVPSALRDATDSVAPGVEYWAASRLPPGSDAAIFWAGGDRIISGSSALIRRMALAPNSRIFWPIHLPCLPEIDLVALQPRVWTASQTPPRADSGVRISGTLTPSAAVSSAIENNTEPWARLLCALLQESDTPGAGLETLSKLWRDSAVLAPVHGALVIRNLILLQIKAGNTVQAEGLLSLAMDYYPRYAELPLLAAWLSITRNNTRRAGRYLQQALENPDRSFLGGGGETDYRAHWLLGLAAEMSGKQALAVQCYLAGISARPAFPPAVLGLLRQRLSVRDAARQARTLLSLVHREPQYLEPVFHFFLIHQQDVLARRLLEHFDIADDVRHRLASTLDGVCAASVPQRRKSQERPSVVLTGPFWVNSSLARINRELAAALAGSSDLEVAMEPFGFAEALGNRLPHFDLIAEGFRRRLSRIDLTIRHHWPPDFGPARSGKLACIFPWEYSSIPSKWADEIRRNVSEIWVPSQFVATVLARAGVDSARIQVIPNGLDPEVFRPDGASWKPEGCRSFVFLFVGGAIQRKGLDILWSAYSRAFSVNDDVTLLIKDIGSATYYSGSSLLESVRAAASRPLSPHLITLSEEINDVKLAALYRGCDVFVLPYRGEGFGMPLAEALACGKPVITTELGPAPEFCPPEASHFIPARTVEFLNPQNPFGPVTGPETWFEPDVNELVHILRYAVEHRETGARQGLLAAEKIRTALSWNRVTSLQLRRVRELTADRH